MWRTPFCEGLARVYHLWVWGGGGGWHECTTCGCGGGGGLARVYHLYVGSHFHSTAVGTVSLVSLSRCSGLGLRFPVPG